jgi:hypothetical protein
MHYLIWSGRIATPMAMVSILFYEITHSVSVERLVGLHHHGRRPGFGYRH